MKTAPVPGMLVWSCLCLEGVPSSTKIIFAFGEHLLCAGHIVISSLQPAGKEGNRYFLDSTGKLGLKSSLEVTYLGSHYKVSNIPVLLRVQSTHHGLPGQYPPVPSCPFQEEMLRD